MTDVFIKKHYPQWNRSVRKGKELERLKSISSDAQTIKYADILDNSREIVQHDKGFAAKLLLEYRSTLLTLNRGNGELRKRAIKAVEIGIVESGVS